MKRLLVVLITLITSFTSFTAVISAATSLSLSSSTTSPKVGQEFTVTLTITSSDSTLGTDVVLAYDHNLIDFTSVTPGTIYPNYSPAQAPTTPGKVFISAVSDFTKGVTPTGTFATVAFTPKAAGTTQIALDYQPQATNLTQVIPFDPENSTNLLSQAPPPLALTITSDPLGTITKSGFPLFIIPLALIVIFGTVIFIRRSKRIENPERNRGSADPELVEGPTPPLS